jgi:hypothetical protein
MKKRAVCTGIVDSDPGTPDAAVCTICCDQEVAAQLPPRIIRRAADGYDRANIRIMHLVDPAVKCDGASANAIEQQRQQTALRKVRHGFRAEARVQRAALTLRTAVTFDDAGCRARLNRGFTGKTY